MQLPSYIKVDPTSKTGLRYSDNRGKRRAGDEAGWLSEYGYWRVTIEEIHDDRFLRHRG